MMDMIAFYQVRVDGERHVTLSGETGDLDKIVAILSGHQSLLARLHAAEAEVARLRDGILRLQDGLMDRDADRFQCLLDNVPYDEDDDSGQDAR
jgi:hypothetical protein